MRTSDFDQLLRWYRSSQRPLPWRESTDPYPVLISEFMLQQTTVAAVIPKFRAWMERFPSIESLAAATLDDVLVQWSGLGYYQRARRLHNAAKEIVELGGFPDLYENLLKLSGIGPYTAAAVASICFARAHLSIDTNVIRVLYRYYAIPKAIGDTAVHNDLREKLKPFLGVHHPGECNQALMELGAVHCSVREPSCLLCPLREGCEARISPGGPAQFPLPSPKKSAKQTPGRVMVIEREASGEILLLKGTSLGLLSELHQPLIHFYQDVSSNAMAAFALTTWGALSGRPCLNRWELSYAISGRSLRLECFHWRLADQNLRPVLEDLEAVGLQYRWWGALEAKVSTRGEKPLAVSTLTRKVLQRWEENRLGFPLPDSR